MLHVEPIRTLADNICWILVGAGGRAAAVDPGDAEPVRRALDRLDLELDLVLLTHHHGDHTAGAADLAGERPVVGPAGIAAVSREVVEGDTVTLGEEALEVWHTPGHTRDHLCFIAPGVAVSGDTLFSGGCGRLFEGTAEQMHASLSRLAALPPETLVLCGHEYTVPNLEFAAVVEPDNTKLATRLQLARRAAAADRLSVPSNLAEELATNPFLRTDEPSVRAAVERRTGGAPVDDVQALAELRVWKNELS